MRDANRKQTPAGAPAGPSGEPADQHRRSPARLATMIALPIAVLACLITFLVLASDKQEAIDEARAAGQLRDVPAPSANEAACRALLDAMPDRLGEYTRTEPDTAVPGYLRWSTGEGPAVELRCGTDRPADLSRTSKLQVVSGVQWLRVSPVDDRDGGATWVAVDRRPYVSMWIPDNAGTAPIQAASKAAAEHLARASLDLGN